MKEYTEEQIKQAYEKILQLIKIVGELEATFEGRHFTLDGHLVGSIGEIMAAYYYGIELYDASAPIHDGKTQDGREVQIKITQQDRIVINEKPDYLLVLFLNRKTGKIYEVYNGSGNKPWEEAYIYKKRNTRYMMLSKLIEADKHVDGIERIKQIHKLEKFQNSNVVIHRSEKNSEVGKTLNKGYVNKNNQKNCGCTGKAGNHEGQMFYEMQCQQCGYKYEANGCDVWLRKCPRCM